MTNVLFFLSLAWIFRTTLFAGFKEVFQGLIRIMSRSKFAVLNVDDDSDSEGTSQFQAPAKTVKKGGAVP